MNGIMSFLKKSTTSPFLSAIPEGHYKHASSEGGVWNTVRDLTGLNNFADMGTHFGEGNIARGVGSGLLGGVKLGLSFGFGGLARLGARFGVSALRRTLGNKSFRQGFTDLARGVFREGVKGPAHMIGAAARGTRRSTVTARKALRERTGNRKARLWRDHAGIKPMSDQTLNTTALGRFAKNRPTASNWALTGGAVGGSIGLDSMMQEPQYEQQRNTNPYGINLGALAAATGSPPTWMSR